MMKQLGSFLRANALFISLVVGVLFGLLELEGFWPWITPAAVLPWCIFFMLFFTFLSMDPRTLRLHRWHFVILAFQILCSLCLFYLSRSIDLVLAQGLFICVLMPSATAAPVIAGKLGGDVTNLTAYTLLSNSITAVLVPLLFPLVNPDVDMPFWSSFVMILRRIAPLLIGPFLLAILLRFILNCSASVRPLNCSSFAVSSKLILKETPFLLWIYTLVVLMAKMTRDLAAYDGSLSILAAMFLGALVTCILQFYVGKWVGERMPVLSEQETRVTCGQALGQKNTTLGIWLAGTYLDPISALAPAAYIVWQNLFNSWQLSRTVRHKHI